MEMMVDRVFSKAWFWCVFIPLLVATCAAGVDKHDLMVGMFIVAGVFGIGFGIFHASQNGWFE